MEVVIESASSGNRYKIIIQQEGDGISLSCNCPAGASGGFCKHRFALIDGDTKDVVEATGDVATIPSLVEGTELEVAINRMHDQERAIKDAHAELKQIKKMVGRVMLGSQRKPGKAEIEPHTRTGDIDPDNTRVLAGKTVVFTGSLDRLTRSEARIRAEKEGAKVSGTISEKTDFLVAGEDVKSDRKLAKADKLGVTVITEMEFIAMLSEATAHS
jgi:NAD-dependent DNA ligase